MIPFDRIGHVDQVALATDRPAVELRPYGGIELRLHPARGLDVGGAWFRGIPLAWISPAGEGGSDAPAWREAWGGGLVTTCGLDNVGRPSEGVGLHGTYTFLPASGVELEHEDGVLVCRGSIEDPRGLRVERTISTSIGEGRFELVDRTRNHAAEPVSAQLLYHVNLGWPLWDGDARVESDAAEVRPRDADASGHDWRTAPGPHRTAERVWEHVDATRATVANERLGLRVTIRSDLPRLWQWVDPTPGYYALALEPANCSVLGRAHDRAEGRLPVLESNEERTTTLGISAHLI